VAHHHGASLYFTVLTRQAADDPAGQWQRAKQAASEAIVARGATITHHHAVGTDHRAFMEAEIGPLGVRALQAVKRALDPQGILNPGKLLPDPTTTPETEQT
jgi:alkyldihydroxyacetonephosphate synthase